VMKRLIIGFVFLVILGSGCNTAPATLPPAPPTSTLLTFPPTYTPSSRITETAGPAPAPVLNFFQMVDRSNGWGADQKHILKTSDGGATWFDVTPAGLGDLGFDIRLDVLDADHVWFVIGQQGSFDAGTLYRTADGGGTWDSVPVPFAAGDIRFLDPGNGWVLADHGVGAGSNAIAVFQTTDGGKTWTQTYTNDPGLPGAVNSLPLGGLKYGLVPVSMQKAWVGGIIYATGVVYLYVTEDGGHTWVEQSVPLPEVAQNAQLETNGPIFITAKDGYLPVHYTADAVQTLVFVTHDGGKTWTLLPGRIPGGRQVQFVSLNDGFAWDGSQLNITHDGGKTWTPVTSSTSFGADFWRMDFITPSTGWAMTMDATSHVSLFATTDGGATWTALIP
jgi:photosystem II stability/assembly factor-like uncharacterized protein